MATVIQQSYSEYRDLPVTDQDHRGQWFAVYTASRHEKRVAEHFNIRQIEHFLPLYAARHRWKNGLTTDLQLPLFPGYLFVRFCSREHRTRILQVPGVFSIVGGPDWRGAAIDESTIDGLKQGLQLRKIEPHHTIEIGEFVRIRSGLLAGMPGILIRRKNDLRVVITLSQIMQSISVEVDESLIDPMPAASELRSAPAVSSVKTRRASADYSHWIATSPR